VLGAAKAGLERDAEQEHVRDLNDLVTGILADESGDPLGPNRRERRRLDVIADEVAWLFISFLAGS